MSGKRGLGSGLSGLLTPDRPRPNGLREVAVAAIIPNPHQPRTHFEPDALAELTASIRQHGVLQPLVVTALPSGDYQLIAGERRWRAAQAADLTTVPVIIKEATEQEQLELALIENIQRDDLDALEEALAYRALAEEFHLTQEQIAERVGKSRTIITQTLGVLRLPPEVQQKISEGRLKLGHVRPLVALKDANIQRQAAQKMVDQGLTVRQAEALAMTLRLQQEPPESVSPRTETEDQLVVTNLQKRLGVRVAIQRTSKGGRLSLYFDDDAMLQRIYDLLHPAD